MYIRTLRPPPVRMGANHPQPLHRPSLSSASHLQGAHRFQVLKPDGLLLIRDYGRHDLAQLRMKKERLLDPDVPNLYIRGDGTRAYFFSQEDLEGMLRREEGEGGRSMFALEQLGEDRRMVSPDSAGVKSGAVWLMCDVNSS